MNKEIEEIESKITGITSETGGGCEFIGAIIFGLLAFVLLYIESTRIAGAVIGAILILMIIFSESNKKAVREIKEKESIKLRNELEEKKRELAEHQGTVSGNN